MVPGAADSFRRGLDPRAFEPDGPPRPYDAIVCCVPNDVFAELLDPGLAADVGAEYLARLEAIEYFTALNLVLELERPLTEHFWVNIADRRYPFVGLIEHSNFVGAENTGGRVFSHVTNYLPAEHELLGLDADELLDRYAEGLRMLNPSFERSWVRRSVGLSRARRAADRRRRLPRADPAAADPGRRPAARQHDPDLSPGPGDQLRDPRRRARRGRGDRRARRLICAKRTVAISARRGA